MRGKPDVVKQLKHLGESRRHFIGGSDARIIMGPDEKALIRLWQEKRGEVGQTSHERVHSSS
jgi:predicted phage-related endonuclease